MEVLSVNGTLVNCGAEHEGRRTQSCLLRNVFGTLGHVAREYDAAEDRLLEGASIVFNTVCKRASWRWTTPLYRRNAPWCNEFGGTVHGPRRSVV